MRRAYAIHIGFGAPHRFQSKTDRDEWVAEWPVARKPCSRETFMRLANHFGEFKDHDHGEMMGFLVDWRLRDGDS